ncbi:MAG: hypothetical protein ACXWKC_13220 [Xanthobacteraceae bacterium]
MDDDMLQRKLLTAISIVAGLSFVATGFAEAAQPRDAVWASCRKQLFKKYGRKGHDGKRYLPSNFSIQATDQCVRNGGKIS